MVKYLLRRIAMMLVVLIGITFIVFFVTNLLPANPARVAAGPSASNEEVAMIAEKMGLNKPLPIRYLIYLGDLLHLDMGKSILSKQPVLKEVSARIAATLELTLAATTVYIIVSLSLGIYCARHPGWIDSLTRMFCVGSSAIPPYWLALLLQLVFYYYLGLLPSGGRLPANLSPPEAVTGLYILDSILAGNWETLKHALIHLVLPTVSLALGNIGLTTRVVRTQVTQEMSQDYVRTAKAKGLTDKVAVRRHAVKNAMNPIVTTIGIQTGYMMVGTIMIETIFRWPGLGSYAITSIQNLDFPAITGIAIVMALSFSVINLLVDLIYMLLNPRVRLT